MKPFDPDSFDSDFDPRQLDLPLSLRSLDREKVWESQLDYPSPQQKLAHFLDEIGVSQPMRMAGVLLRDFGSVGAIMSASWWRLRGSVGIRVANAISASRDLMRLALTEAVASGPVLSSKREVVMLLQAELGSLRRERVIAIYVDSKLQLLRIERISEGSVNNAPLDISRIVHCGLDVGASGFLVVHNHPSGDTRPSAADKGALARLGKVAADLDMTLIDALIIAGGECRSVLRDWGLS